VTDRRAVRVSGKAVLAALRRHGWVVVNVRGSHHHYLRHPLRGGKVTVPVHGTDVLQPKTLGSILTQAELTEDELRGML
jgi:predicted RNA binding protein YcfA (HicA-like mRNA interferase family)